MSVLQKSVKSMSYLSFGGFIKVNALAFLYVLVLSFDPKFVFDDQRLCTRPVHKKKAFHLQFSEGRVTLFNTVKHKMPNS